MKNLCVEFYDADHLQGFEATDSERLAKTMCENWIRLGRTRSARVEKVGVGTILKFPIYIESLESR